MFLIYLILYTLIGIKLMAWAEKKGWIVYHSDFGVFLSIVFWPLITLVTILVTMYVIIGNMFFWKD
jgi:hypothetical protein